MDIKRAAARWGIILLLLMGYGCSKAPLPPENEGDTVEKPNNSSRVIISSADQEGQIVDSAQVYWDGEFIGDTPLTEDGIEFGIHSLRVQKAGYELFSESVEISSAHPAYFEAILKELAINKGQLIITVAQDSVTTTLRNSDNDILDQFCCQEKSFILDPGGYFLKAERPGYQLFHVAVEIKIDSIVIQNIQLERIENTEMPEVALAIPDSGQVNVPVVFSWESNNAVSVDIDYVENPGLSGRREVIFQLAGKKYVRATAYNNAGSITVVDSIVIADPVDDPQLPPEIEISVQPEIVSTGENATIRWESSNASSVAVDYVPSAGLSGAWQINFNTPGEYQILAHAYGPGGEAVAAASLIVESPLFPDPPVINEFVCTPDSIVAGETAILHWDVSGEGVSVFIDQGIGAVGQTGNQNVSPDVGTLYTISASNDGGTVSKSVFLKVEELPEPVFPPPTLDFSVTPEFVEFGNALNVAWSSDGYQVIIDQGIGVRGPYGTEEMTFSSPGWKVFTAVAYGENEQTTIKVDSVFINEPVSPETPAIWLAVVDSAEVGSPVLIEWHSQNAEQVDVDYVSLPGLNGKSEVIFYSEGRRVITATAYNQTGQVTVSDTLEVVLSSVEPQVLPVYVLSLAKVAAIHPTVPAIVNNAGEGVILQEGYYRVSATVWYNSGDVQKNESFFITIKDNLQNEIYPEDSNAGLFKVVPDDPGEAHLSERNAGLFYLQPGDVTFVLHHYYTISEEYPQFIVDGPINGPESVEVVSFKLEYVQP